MSSWNLFDTLGWLERNFPPPIWVTGGVILLLLVVWYLGFWRIPKRRRSVPVRAEWVDGRPSVPNEVRSDQALRKGHQWEGRIVLIWGRLGTGKTAYAVHRAVSAARGQKVPIISNAPIRPDALVVRSWEDLAKLVYKEGRGNEEDIWQTPAVIVLDEVHLWIPSQQGLMPIEEQRDAAELLSYARKAGWLVIATTQYPTKVATVFRQLVTDEYQVRKIIDGSVHRAIAIDPDTGKELSGIAAIFSPRRAVYNTRAAVEPLWRKERDRESVERQWRLEELAAKKKLTQGKAGMKAEKQAVRRQQVTAEDLMNEFG